MYIDVIISVIALIKYKTLQKLLSSFMLSVTTSKGYPNQAKIFIISLVTVSEVFTSIIIASGYDEYKSITVSI